MKSKRKILISMLAVLFVLVAIVATIAIVFALTQQTIKSSLNITYVAKDVSATIRAEVIYADGTVENMVTASNATSIEFKAEDTNSDATALNPANDITLSSDATFVYLKYYFQNNGSNDFIATFEYEDTDVNDENISLSNRISENEYSKTMFYPTLVKGGDTATCTLKIAIDNVARDGEFSGNLICSLDSNIIVATPDTAQAILDAGVNNTTVVFDEGTYGDLVFRPTRETVDSVHYFFSVSSWLIYNNNITDYDSLADDKSYLYSRTLENITLLGLKGSKFTGVLAVESTGFGWESFVTPARSGITADNDKLSAEQIAAGNSRYDYVANRVITYKGGNTSTDYGFYARMSVNNFTAKYMDFEGINGRVNFRVGNSAITFYNDRTDFTETWENITINNCTFNTNEHFLPISDGGLGAVHFDGNWERSNRVTGIQIENNYSSGHYFSYYTRNVEDVTINNNVSLNTYHNGIAVQSYGSNVSAGDIVITNNIVENAGYKYNNGTYEIVVSGSDIGQRAVRLNACSDATIVIGNNTFKNCVDQDGELLKAGALTNSSYEFVNNTYNGSAVADKSGTSNLIIDINS